MFKNNKTFQISLSNTLTYWDKWLRCTSVSACLHRRTLSRRWQVWGCHTSCGASSDHRYRSCCSCPSYSKDPSYHSLRCREEMRSSPKEQPGKQLTKRCISIFSIKLKNTEVVKVFTFCTSVKDIYVKVLICVIHSSDDETIQVLKCI